MTPMAMMVTIWNERSITRPILRLVEITQAIAKTGKLDHMIEVDVKDEVGHLASAFNRMIGSLRKANRVMRVQRDIGFALGSSRDLTESLNSVLENVLFLEGINCGGIFLVDRNA